jgi:hypothetical protein
MLMLVRKKYIISWLTDLADKFKQKKVFAECQKNTRQNKLFAEC